MSVKVQHARGEDRASDCLEDLAGSRPSFDRHLEFGDFLRLLVADFLVARVLGRAFGFVISFSMVFCWRCISAVQKPLTAPAQVFAVLSQRLIQGFFAISDLAKQANAPP